MLQLDSATTTLHMTGGCGITTQGYLAVEAENLALTSYRAYNLVPDMDYPLLRDKSQASQPQYPLWELFAAGEPNVTPLSSPAGFLDDKAVLLFIELKKEGLRNCNPNDCNDRGSQVTVTVRRLLIDADDLAKVMAEAAGLAAGQTVADLEASLLVGLNLPDLRLPRLDVPETALVSTQQVLAAFYRVFYDTGLARHTGAALSAAYAAFKPLLQDLYPNDPFAGFQLKFGFLEDLSGNAAQFYFLQYYCDLFDDLLRGYDEMRWKGVELVCTCCPGEHPFPRHLMLGIAQPVSVANPELYRQGFSPACLGEQQREAFRQLFQRLVVMVDSFTYQPRLPDPSSDAPIDRQVRITPSVYGARPLAEKALPYYYGLSGTPPLYHLWNPEHSRRRRANQNLGYRSDEYTPAAPPFVLDALRYDLEPYDFLRIEGHLGKPYQSVLDTLLRLKARYRLPIEILALRTGAFDETAQLAASNKTRFPDLEALYDVLREELLTNLCEGVRYLYDVVANVDLPGGTPSHPLLQRRAPQYRYGGSTVGAWYEKYLASFLARPYIDVDQHKTDANAILTVYCALFTGTTGLPNSLYAHVVSIYYMSTLSETLPASLDALAYADFENKCQDLLSLTRYFRSDVSKQVTADLQQFIPQEALIDHFDQVLYGCNLEAIKALHEEYLRRLRELKQQQMLGYFLRQHPGIQHKAGVPLGGTFVLVYHQEANARAFMLDERARAMFDAPLAAGGLKTAAFGTLDSLAVSRALGRIGRNSTLVKDPDVRMVLASLTGEVPEADIRPVTEDDDDSLISQSVRSLEKGTVIADFFLPYRCAGDGPGVQYVLPLPPLGLSVKLSCTNEAGNAATLEPIGGQAPYAYQLDDQPFKALTTPVLLSAGDHTLAVRDSAGAQSALQTVSVPSALHIGQEAYIDDVNAMTYQVRFTVTGGVMPYSADNGSLDVSTYTSDPVPSEQPLRVNISDCAGCSVHREFSRIVPPRCDLPCDGLAMRCGHRFWLPEPEPEPERRFVRVQLKVDVFRFELRAGGMVDLTSEVEAILSGVSSDDLNNNFDAVAQKWTDQINRLIAGAIDDDDWLRLDYTRNIGGMAVLGIEYFVCLKFEFRIRAVIMRSNIDTKLPIETLYTPAGTEINVGPDFPTVVIPPFNCSRIAKCDPERPVTHDCTDVDLTLKINQRLEGNQLTLKFTATGRDKPVAFLWEVQDCLPSVSANKSDTLTVMSGSPTVKSIRLTAFTERGCAVVATGQFTVG
ncbi:hypothetical protein ACIQUS_20100 [Pseudomonas sp. NPDC090755]|uniref:hypothetical protein n=1 Tax=Pseudomonas sp. NPDC090755 TaxID=3364481 RepID=UPI00383A8CF5